MLRETAGIPFVNILDENVCRGFKLDKLFTELKPMYGLLDCVFHFIKSKFFISTIQSYKMRENCFVS